MRFAKLISSTAAVPVLIGALAAPAQAVTYVDVNAKDVVVRYDDCKRTPAVATGDWSEDLYNEVRVTVRGPAGRLVTSRTL